MNVVLGTTLEIQEMVVNANVSCFEIYGFVLICYELAN